MLEKLPLFKVRPLFHLLVITSLSGIISHVTPLSAQEPTAVMYVTFSPDGSTALSGQSDGKIKLWEVGSGHELKTFAGHSEKILSVVFSPDGHTALSASSDKTIKLWDVASGHEIRTFAGHSDAVWCATFSPDGRTVLSGSADKTIRLWDITSGRVLRTFRDSQIVVSVAFSPDGLTVLSGSADKTIKLWDATTGRVLRTFQRLSGSVNSVAFSPDGRRALSGSYGTVNLWDLASGALLRTFTANSTLVLSVAFSPDGRTALSSGDSKVELWDVASGHKLRTFRGHSSAVNSVAFSPDGSTALSGSTDKTIKLWDIESGREIRTFGQEPSPVISQVGPTAESSPLFASTPSSPDPGRRVALIIGNSAYASVGKLLNPIRDAEAVATSLRNAGFSTVTIKDDVTRSSMLAALNGFSDQAANASWAAIYFSGHGLEVDGTNYVVPIDAKLLADRDVEDEAISLDRLLKATLGARKLHLVILDACRDDPFVSNMKRTVASRSIGRGLARVEPEGATLVVYAAKDGQIAYDGDGQNSPFVTALTKRIGEPNLEINMLFRQVRDDVLAATGRKQEPYVYGSLPGENFYFVQQ